MESWSAYIPHYNLTLPVPLERKDSSKWAPSYNECALRASAFRQTPCRCTLIQSGMSESQCSANIFKELAIVGSLTSIALDLVRYHLFNEGLNLGLLGSGVSMASPSWLWSNNLISGIRTSLDDRPKLTFKTSGAYSGIILIVRSKLFLFTLLVSSTFLATAVGPASALLIIPTQLWVQGADTHFLRRRLRGCSLACSSWSKPHRTRLR